MYAVATFIIVSVITLVFTRMVTGALIATGLPPEVASFQARSAFSGAGFTTTESENVVNHPVRRRIVFTTMLVGSLGTPTLVVTVLAGLLVSGPGDTADRAWATIIGLLIVLVVLGSGPVRRALIRYGQRYARRRLLPALEGVPNELLDLGDDQVVVEVALAEDPDRAPRSLTGIEQALPGVRVLAVRRTDGDHETLVAESPADLTLRHDDRLVLFGPRQRVRALVPRH